MAKNISLGSWGDGLRGNLGMALLAIACVGLVLGLQLPRLNQIRNSNEELTLPEIERELAQEQIRLQVWRQIPSFSFDNLLANWVFLQFAQYFGDDPARLQTGYRLSPRYFEIIVDRDPRFLGAYVPLSTSISLYSAQPEISIALMDQGLKSMNPQTPPRSYFVWRLKAIDQLLFLGDGVGAKQSFLTSADWASNYTDEESQYLTITSRQTAEFLDRNPNSKNAQVAAWTMVIGNVTDARTKEIARQRLEALGARIVTNADGSINILNPIED